jgi:hypothetical protein
MTSATDARPVPAAPHERRAQHHRELERELRRAADAAPASRSIDLFTPATQSSSST